jgi:hypothetical protein
MKSILFLFFLGFINSLPTNDIHPSMVTPTSTSVPEPELADCAICWRPMESHDAVMVFSCDMHEFHEDCAVEWMVRNLFDEQVPTCPLCRAVAKGFGSDDESDSDLEGEEEQVSVEDLPAPQPIPHITSDFEDVLDVLVPILEIAYPHRIDYQYAAFTGEITSYLETLAARNMIPRDRLHTIITIAKEHDNGFREAYERIERRREPLPPRRQNMY